ncbi:MAG: phosphoribosylaminoimidazolesuccinocarboxamide synthase [Candidatus Berkelbacteria bacterium]|nr:MAG: phosphoribosylaminoimidazolesuccinocarboxamide synthase [Candidatus Berkelbacteria bacterium]QQG51781.1 MAG: phosphoribosylaminoimidazolesuccinocarboxamide synthase [Candidatus Berkelbacteria bacterium]
MSSSAPEKRGDQLAEGKTKIIWPTSNLNVVLVESKDDITAGDGAKHDILEGKAVAANTTTCNVFELINCVGLVPTHFLARHDDRTFRAVKARMVPIEVVARRVVAGSYLKRNPDVAEGTKFPDLVIEFFYKDDAEHDPIMICKFGENGKPWFSLHDAKQPISAVTELGKLSPREVEALGLNENHINLMRLGAASVFETLERAWLKHHMVLVDLKVEFGFDRYGRLILADVIDNDSWRIWHYGQPDGMLDKQVYRNLSTDDPEAKAEAMAKISDNYQRVAKMTESFF